jgi:hypothetical protein
MAIDGGRNIGSGDLNDTEACSCNATTPETLAPIQRGGSKDNNAIARMEAMRSATLCANAKRIKGWRSIGSFVIARSEATKQSSPAEFLDCFASLAMTAQFVRCAAMNARISFTSAGCR